MNRDDRPSDQRKSYRFPVPESQQAAELRVGNRSFPGRLYNASAGGFALWLAENPGLSAGDRAELRTSAGAFEVRVAHVGPPADAARSASPGASPVASQVGASPGVEAGAGEGGESSGFRLGLERVSDVRVYGSGNMPARCKAAPSTRPSAPPTAGLAYAAVVVLMAAVLVGALAVKLQPAGWIAPWTTHGAAPAAASVAWPGTTGSPQTGSTPTRPAAMGSAATGHGAVPTDAGDVPPEIADAFRRAGVTAEQTGRLLGALRQTAGALGEIEQQLARRSEAERAATEARIVEALQREIATQLTDAQRRWLRRAVIERGELETHGGRRATPPRGLEPYQGKAR